MKRFPLRKIVCALSGGVDSTVAALLLKRKGYEVLGVHMKNWDLIDEYGQCVGEKDQEDARSVCEQLGIPFKEVNFVKEYWNRVFSDFLADYKKGITPNPDILCNKRIKFHSFLNYALSHLGADAVATGHYVRTTFGEDLENYDETAGVRLLRGIDPKKDQSFFMSQVSQQALRHCIFPLGNLTKQQVKNIAISANFHKIAKKKESMGLCFVGRRNFQKFIEDYIEPRPGELVDLESGHVVGMHNGIHYWTLGQRCSIPNQRAAYFIAEKDPDSATIYVVPGTNHPALFHCSFQTEQPHWIHSCPERLTHMSHMQCGYKFQHKDPIVECKVQLLQNGQLYVKLDHPVRALTPGQYAVFYDKEECLGSARIIDRGNCLYSEMETRMRSRQTDSCVNTLKS